ncbi:hypothetical protein JCM16418A_09650 [Paenibacillus pini]|uniref:Flagellar protein FlbB n=1 Tax=Paenibacillus pini JCM 16418 TaxID=1236976 RepID=W7YMK6_9BACL|nr:flagellar protein FlbB [Paenibacillus pini JCM 16418]
MAHNDFDLEKETTGRFERVLFFMIPIIFTIVLLVVLLTLLNVNWRNNMLEFANKIPVVNKWVPEPDKDPEKTKLDESKQQVKSAKATIEELKNKLATKETALQKANEEKQQQETKLKNAQEELDSMQLKNQSQTSSDEEDDPYDKQIKDLAKMYANMSPSKSAPILQSMTTAEIVQLLSAMKNDSRIAILEKMDPKIAAEVTTMLKEVVSSSDLAIAALQSRINKNSPPASSESTGLDRTQISQTFASMPPKSAAMLVLKTYKISPEKALKILNSVTDSTRSSILDAMSSQDATTSAVILNKLMSTK